ncbi:hypothetical protein DBR43_26750 [Pedobacter sp. KBW06]|uniref:hypothetical protein n=1 Tax=Pedobacter sp. KBW06 TaxID=2153359 RepID=UPI000F59C488|nr:hypothetical protein [Pedobacter sp. KBW06]RQO65851.1 hypothetical protein DBR43_26750 [Pedobacter sp. KBW06]
MKKPSLTSKIKCVLFSLDELNQSADIKDLLLNLDLPYAVVSVKPKANMEQLLNAAGLLPFFREDRMFSASVQLTDFPSGMLIFLRAVKSMGFEPCECAVLDSSDMGIDLALREDFCVFVMKDAAQKAELENKGVLGLNKFSDLSEFIELFNEEADLETRRN